MIYGIDMTNDAFEQLFFKQMKMLSIRPKRASKVGFLQERNEFADDFYDDTVINESLDCDSISSYEAGFMKGYICA